jgi:hypothetical protein
MENKVLEFGNYLLSINNDNDKKIHIEGSIINHPNKNLLINMFRPEDELENKTVLEKDKDGNDIEVNRYSQLREWVVIFGLNDNQEIRNELNNYLNYFLSVKQNL